MKNLFKKSIAFGITLALLITSIPAAAFLKPESASASTRIGK
ncbi:MAG: hypothetical protein ACRCUS_09300 [Anaerovoracaceae bacterium]